MSSFADMPSASSASAGGSVRLALGRASRPARGVAAFVYTAERDSSGGIHGFRCELCSGAAARMAGRPNGEIVGARLDELWPELGAPAIEQHLIEVVERAEPWDTEIAVERDGAVRTLAVAAVAVGDLLITTIADITTARRVAQAERAGEARLRAAMEATIDGFWLLEAVTDPSGRVVDMRVIDLNRRVERQLGKPRTSLVGRLVSEILPSERGRTLVDGCAQVFDTGAPLREDLAVVDGAASVQWLERQMVPLSEGQVAVTTRDVTARRQQESQLRRQLDSKAALIDAMQDGFVAADAQMALTEVNQRFCEMTGFTRGDLLGTRPPFPFWPSDEHAQGRSRLATLEREGASEFDATYVSRTGEKLPVIVSAAILRDDRGQIVGFLATVKDVGERRRREDELRHSHSAYEALAENSPDVIARFDRDLRHVYVNRAAEVTTGVSRDQIIGRTNRDLGQSEELVERWQSELLEVFRQAAPREVEVEATTLDGVRWFHSRLVPEVDLDGRVRHVLSVSRDVTERKQIELARLESEAAAQELARREVAQRRVAEAVARADSAQAICDVVAAQAAGLLGAHAGWVIAHDDASPPRTLGSWSASGAGAPRGSDRQISLPISLAGRPWGELRVAGDPTKMGDDGIVVLSRFADVVETALANAEAQADLARQARTDPLTGLLNRRAFFERLEQHVHSTRRFAEPVCLAVVDIDEFKRVNDHYGHAVGDEALREVSRRLLAATRSDETIARIGGEEFAWVLPRTNRDQAWAAVERGLKAVSADPVAQIGRLTVSAGLAQLQPDEDPADLLRRADRALYRAKATGRDRLVCDP